MIAEYLKSDPLYWSFNPRAIEISFKKTSLTSGGRWNGIMSHMFLICPLISWSGSTGLTWKYDIDVYRINYPEETNS